MIRSVTSTRRFVESTSGPAQLVEVQLDAAAGTPIEVRARGEVIGTATATGESLVEVALPGVAERAVGERIAIEVRAGQHSATGEVVVAAPGWTVWMIPHFHYDPVWWNTQAAYTSTWDDLGEAAQSVRSAEQQTGFALVQAHLATARRDPDYTFVLAEVDYLKPYWDAFPRDRGLLRRLLAEGRLEIVGGTYNEPNTNLTTAETTARNFVYGIGFQRTVMGADPQTAWQLDVFGHDPQFPGLAAAAGLTSSSWARGPFHQWGPLLEAFSFSAAWGDPAVMQFPAEFEWLSPSGTGVLTHYMPAHYSSGWRIDSKATLAEAEREASALFEVLAEVASTRNVLIPVGTDYTPPSKWATQIQRSWNSRYLSPRMVCGLPRDFFAAVRAELDAEGRRPVPITRDMNPIYTGKDVSFIDTKQAQRRVESLLVEAELFATAASWLGARYPVEAIDKAWRQLVYGAHHDAITGSESDQVYLDLLTGWRDAHDLAEGALRDSLDALAGTVAGDGSPSITVFNPSAWQRTDLVQVVVQVPGWRGMELRGPDGSTVPLLADAVRRDDAGLVIEARLTFLASIPSVGYEARWRVHEAHGIPGWQDEPGQQIENDAYRVRVDPNRGGCIDELVELGTSRSLLTASEVGNELILEAEHSEHPRFHEGPWHLLPTGETVARSSAQPATSVQVQRCAVGARLIVRGTLAGADYEQHITVWHGLSRLDCQTRLEGFTGADQLLRVRWPVHVPGALPVSEVGAAVVGRGFALLGTDSADYPWTLDNPANNWFGLSATARVRLHDRDGSWFDRAIGVAELIAPDGDHGAELRELAVALAASGVTATTSRGDGARYGALAVDSNLPDVRISVGPAEQNSFTAAVLDAAGAAYRRELDDQLAERGWAAVWVPAERELRSVWQPGADLSGTRSLPVLLLCGEAAVRTVVDDLADATIELVQSAGAATEDEPPLDDHTVALINFGTPGFAVTSDGALHMSLLRSCTGWPSGVWIDPPARRLSDGSTFQQQHWTHEWDYRLVSGPGDWRATGVVRAGHDANHPLRSSVATQSGHAAAHAQLLELRGSGDVVLAALKPRGNPLAAGRAATATGEITLRLYEAAGRQAEVLVAGVAGGTLLEPAVLDLTEEHAEPVAVTHTPAGPAEPRFALQPMQIATVGARVVAAATPLAGTELGRQAELHQPVQTRYWLDNTGPAPLGGLPIAVHLEPQVIPLTDAPADLILTVASDRTDEPVEVRVQLVLPPGWTADGAEFVDRLEPGGWASHPVRVTPAADLSPGTYWLRARSVCGEQTIEDVARVIVGTDTGTELTVRREPQSLSLCPGEETTIAVELTNSAHTAVSARVQLIGPWHTWDMLPQWDSGADVPAGGSTTVQFPVRVPAGTRPGSWWAIPKIASAGFVHFAEPVQLHVRAGAQ